MFIWLFIASWIWNLVVAYRLGRQQQYHVTEKTVLQIALGCLVTPGIEELLFRKFLHELVLGRWAMSRELNAALFGLAHCSNALITGLHTPWTLVNQVVMTTILGYQLMMLDSLWQSYVLHGAYNISGAVVLIGSARLNRVI